MRGSGSTCGPVRAWRSRAARLTALVAVLGAALLSLVGAPAFADHTPLPSQVTLVGSLQSELGCPGDWQPECAQTALLPVAGSPGLFRASFTVPAGAFEYKVALNGTWDENYGAGGAPGGANIPLTAPGGVVTFTYDHETHRIVDDAPRALGAESGAHWVRRGLIAWHPPATRCGSRFYCRAVGRHDRDRRRGGRWFRLSLGDTTRPGCRATSGGTSRTWRASAP